MEKICHTCNEPITTPYCVTHEFKDGKRWDWHVVCYETQPLRLIPFTYKATKELFEFAKKKAGKYVWADEVIKAVENGGLNE